PNQIFTSSLLGEKTRSQVLHAVVNNLTYKYGVASLSQDDKDFHPYHQYDPFYPKDAAYHNGTVWTWVQGKVISELCNANEEKLAARITENCVHQIIDRGAVGTQSELLDAIARPGEKEPRLSGTFSQAWNLAEFIRNFYDDYLGIRVELIRHHLVLRPKLPHSFGRIKATINLNGRSLPIELARGKGTTTIGIDGRNLRKGGTAEIVLPSSLGDMTTSFRVPPQSDIRLSFKDTSVTLMIDGVKQDSLEIRYQRTNSLGASLHLAQPRIRLGLRSLKGPDYPLISSRVVKASDRSSKVLLAGDDAFDDDKGTGAFQYPLNPLFKKGSFDILGFRLFTDKRNAYFSLKFKALSNPGWHPEYGFQLTYVAIAIDEDGIRNSGKRQVEHNANYLLDEQTAYEKLILIGGGVRLEDKNGKIIAAYVPTEADVHNPLGDAESGTISFAIPLSYLGVPKTSWRFTVLVGAQDDHGGAGIGEFRTVNKEAGEWNGGGKKNPGEPNIYDVLVISK
ncbi:MAG: glucodextranase DOMON-like domain-containing protein, partial [bacterium]